MDHETVFNAIFAQALRETLHADADMDPIQREALAACLTEELTSVSRQLADAVDANWVSGWEKAMAGKLVDVPNIQN